MGNARVHYLHGQTDDGCGRCAGSRAATQAVVVLCILWSIVSFLYETQARNWGKDDVTFFGLEVAVVVVFTIDYVARLLLTPDPRFALPQAFRCRCLPASLGGGTVLHEQTGEEQPNDMPLGFVWILYESGAKRVSVLSLQFKHYRFRVGGAVLH